MYLLNLYIYIFFIYKSLFKEYYTWQNYKNGEKNPFPKIIESLS